MPYLVSQYVVLVLLLDALCLHSCTNRALEDFQHPVVVDSSQQADSLGSALQYNLNEPDLVIDLPGKLDEISGLAMFGDSTLLAVQDEDGRLYSIDIRTGSVKTERKFAGSGDYEGVEIAGDSIFVLNSKGDLFAMPLSNPSVRAVRTRTRLSVRDDTEGLAYDPIVNSLLIAQKESKDKKRSVFAYSFATREVAERPLHSLSTREVELSLSRKAPKGEHYKPAGLALNPSDNLLYVVSSSWKVLVSLDRSGAIQQTYELKDKQIRQPEGVAFDSNGTLYLSTEAKGKKAKVLAYRRQNNSR